MDHDQIKWIIKFKTKEEKNMLYLGFNRPSNNYWQFKIYWYYWNWMDRWNGK